MKKKFGQMSQQSVQGQMQQAVISAPKKSKIFKVEKPKKKLKSKLFRKLKRYYTKKNCEGAGYIPLHKGYKYTLIPIPKPQLIRHFTRHRKPHQRKPKESAVAVVPA